MLHAILRHQAQGNQRFCSVAVQLGFLTEKQALHYLGAQSSYPTVTTWELLSANELGTQISIEFAQHHRSFRLGAFTGQFCRHGGAAR